MKTPLVSFEFSISPAALSAALRRGKPSYNRGRLRQDDIPPPAKTSMSPIEVRVVVGDAAVVFTRELDRTGATSWRELHHDDDYLVWRAPNDEDYANIYVTGATIIGCLTHKLAELTVDRVKTSISGEATVINLGVL